MLSFVPAAISMNVWSLGMKMQAYQHQVLWYSYSVIVYTVELLYQCCSLLCHPFQTLVGTNGRSICCVRYFWKWNTWCNVYEVTGVSSAFLLAYFEFTLSAETSQTTQAMAVQSIHTCLVLLVWPTVINIFFIMQPSLLDHVINCYYCYVTYLNFSLFLIMCSVV